MFLSNYSIKSYIGFTTSVSWASYTCVLFILPMQLANGGQFLNITFLLATLFGWPWAAVSATIMVPLTSIYAWL